MKSGKLVDFFERKKFFGVSGTLNDPRCGPQMILPEIDEWHGVWFPGFFSIFVFIYFHQLNDELDEHNEKIF